MPLMAKCPTCEHSYNVPESQRGKRVKCRNCADIFTVAGGRDADDDDRADDSGRRSARDSDRRDRDDRDDRRPEKRRDRDRDDDRPRKKKGGDETGSMLMILGIVGGVFLLVVVGGGVAIWWAMSRPRNDHVVDVGGVKVNIPRNINVPNVNIPNVNIPNPQPRGRSIFDNPANIDEALEDLRNQGRDGFMRDARSNWLANQPPVEARRKEVCDVLWDVQAHGGHGQDAAWRAFCKWAGPAQADKVVELVNKGRGEAMEAAGRLKLTQVLPALVKRAETDWGARGTIMQNIEAFGAQAGEKELVKYVDSTDHGYRNEVHNLLRKWNTKPEVIIDQYVADINGAAENIGRIAIENLTRTPLLATRQEAVVKAVVKFVDHPDFGFRNQVNNVLKQWEAKPAVFVDQFLVDIAGTKEDVARIALDNLANTPVDATRQPAVVKALKNLMLSTNPDTAGKATHVATIWGTADIAPELIQALADNNRRSDKTKIMEALVKFDTEACRLAIVAQLTNPTGRFAAKAIITKTGAVFEPAVHEFLKSVNDRLQRHEAIQILGAIGTQKSIPVLNQLVVADMSLKFLATQAANAIAARARQQP